MNPQGSFVASLDWYGYLYLNLWRGLYFQYPHHLSLDLGKVTFSAFGCAKKNFVLKNRKVVVSFSNQSGSGCLLLFDFDFGNMICVVFFSAIRH